MMAVGEASWRLLSSPAMRLFYVAFVLQALVITGVGLEVTLSPSVLTVFEGGNAIFTCSPLIPLAVPLLQKDGVIISPQNLPRLSFTDNGRGSSDGNRTYTLQDVEISDNGTNFKCIVAGHVSNTVTMSVFVFPKIEGPSGLVTVLENDTTPTILTYKTFGVPQPHTYQWLRDGVQFTGNIRIKVKGNHTSTFEVREASREDSASYTLVAISTEGQGTLTVELQIAYNEYLEFPVDQEVPQGEMVTFRCVHRFGWSYIWRSGRLRSEINDHRKVSIDPTGVSLQYGPVDYTDHLIDFYCVTRLANGHYYTSPSAMIQVLFSPIVTAPQNYTVVEGSDIIITFDLLGHPSPHTLLYFFDDVQLELDQVDSRLSLVADRRGSLLIRDVYRTDAGVYSLRVLNSLGEDTASTRLIVLSRPIIIPLEVTFIVQVNCQAEIPCGQHVKGCPPASFSWSKMSQSGQIESQFIVDQANGSLLLSSPTRGDSGTYQCTARNSIGMDSALVMVLVLDPPDPPQNVQVLQTGAMWAIIEWLPPDYVGPLPPLSFYEITAEPLYRNGTIISQSDSKYSIPSHDSLEELEQAYLYDQNNGSLDLSFLRGFDPNTTCVEIICERIIVTVDAETTRFNLSGLIPAHSYNLIIRSLSNGTNLISDASDPITITTKPYVPHVGSVIATVFGPGAAHVSWTLAFSGGLPVQFFDLSFKKANDTQWQEILPLSSSNSSFSSYTIPPDFRSWIVNGLESEEHYLFRVRAVNNLGFGNFTVTRTTTLSHIFGVPSPPEKPVITGWADNFAVITSSILKLGLPDSENFTVSVVLMQNGVEFERQTFDFSSRDYVVGSQFQLQFLNLSYRGDWQFTVSCSNDLGESVSSPTSLHARNNIQELRTAYAIAGPVIGCVLGVLNVAALLMVVILFAVMGQESTKQQRNMARRVEMAQAETDEQQTHSECPFSPRCLTLRSSPDGRSNPHITPSESIYAEIQQQTCPIRLIFPTSTSSVSAV